MRKLFYVYLMFMLVASCNSISETSPKAEPHIKPASSEITVTSAYEP